MVVGVILVFVVMMVVVVVVVGVVVLMVSMRMTMAVAVAMSMMSMVKGHHADQIDTKTEDTDGQQFANPFHLRAIDQPFNGLRDDLDADKPTPPSASEHNLSLGSHTSRKCHSRSQPRYPSCRGRTESASWAAIYS